MPNFFKKDLFFNPDQEPQPILDPAHEIESPLDTPELEEPHNLDFNEEEGKGGVNNQKEEDSKHLDFDYEDPEHDPVKTLIEWVAPSRPFRKKDRSFYTTVAILIILVSMLALLAGERILVAALFALMFLVYVISFIAPEDAKYRISTQGVTINDHFYHWHELDSFWFEEKEGFKVLFIATQLYYPAVIMLVLGNTSQDEVKRICARFLPYHEIAPKSTIEKWAESLQKHFPLENPHR